MTDIIERLRCYPEDEIREAAAEIERLRATLKECVEDLAAYIEHHYARTLDYPSQKIKYEREMQPVLDARKLLPMRSPK